MMKPMHSEARSENPVVVVAMDSFKGSLDARRACDAVEEGLRSVMPDMEIRKIPMADGGEGTAETLRVASGGRWIEAQAPGPLPDRDVPGRYLWLPDAGPGALIEMAEVNGLALLAASERDPTRTSTRGTGVLLRHAVDRGATRLWLAIGGSATVDGGTGAARALGWRFLDADGEPVAEGGGTLAAIRRIVPPVSDPLAEVEVQVLCDVDNPLLGPRGAAHIFGPQKGATPDQVDELERGLANLARRIEDDLGLDVRNLAGAGAAGGLGAGAVAFAGASLVSGVDAVMEASKLADALRGADWVVTGEGAFDDQSLHGKVASGVVRRAREAGARVAVVAGSLGLTDAQARAGGVDAAEAAAPPELPLDEAMRRAPGLVRDAAARLARRWRDRGA
jgi:glycerate kinase